MMEIYIVVRRAVYDHGIFGIYTSEENARKGMEVAQSYEQDNHHHFRIEKRILDEDLLKENWDEIDYDTDDIF